MAYSHVVLGGDQREVSKLQEKFINLHNLGYSETYFIVKCLDADSRPCTERPNEHGSRDDRRETGSRRCAGGSKSDHKSPMIGLDHFDGKSLDWDDLRVKIDSRKFRKCK